MAFILQRAARLEGTLFCKKLHVLGVKIIIFKYGFNKNYATGKSYSGVNSKVGSHHDHGHLGTLDITFESIKKIDATIIK